MTQQRRTAVLSGRLQIILAIWVLLDVLRRTAVGREPISALMVGIGSLALLANLLCLVLVRRHREGGVPMRASVIFSTNDTLANLGVIVAGLLVLNGGRRILREARASRV
ncbi:cation transporter [Cyanobium sp. ATX 6A2]|uniref:cation transporter n=1 Tax=Cyanobium sp. ATX 6A2 TaxID=2823700 RepID=UPI0020CEC88F|nr:cation transporter [Cyanobium sp. ATX 6A2]MCP9889414.1 cation transporter [Cyanobium sp. ATX 6A2]